MTTPKTKRQRWTIIVIDPTTNHARQLQIGGWEDTSWLSQKTAQKTAKAYEAIHAEYNHPYQQYLVVPGDSWDGKAEEWNAEHNVIDNLVN